MDELLASVEDMVNHLNYAMYVEPVGTTPFPIAKLQRIGNAYHAYMAKMKPPTVYKCLVCRVEPANALDAVCPKCKRNRSPRPAGVAPWEVVA